MNTLALKNNVFTFLFVGLMLTCLSTFTGCGIDPSALGNYALSDLVGTWSGSLTQAGVVQTFQITVDSSGNFTANTGVSGTASISSLGVATFTYATEDGFTAALTGTLNSGKTDIVMSTYAWSGAASGSSELTGTLTKATTSTTDFKLADLVGNWDGTLKIAGQSSSYDVTVDSSGKMTIGDSITGTATITASGTVVFMYTKDGETVTMEGTMSNGKTKITMTTRSWTGTS
jgi:hypothetical protein